MAAPTQDWQSSASVTEGLKRLWHDEVATDVVFTFPRCGEILKAHRNVLMARSPVFYRMFSPPFYQPGEDIRIDDLEPQVFKDLLRFLYEDGVEVTATNVSSLLYAAEKYATEELRATCVKFLAQNMSHDSVATVLDMGVLYGEEKLVKKSTNYIVYGCLDHLEVLKEHHVSKDTLKMLVDCSTLAVPETELFKACDFWAEVECRKRDLEVNQKNKRQVLDGILPQIRFCSMTAVEMDRIVTPAGLLTSHEELDIKRSIESTDQTDAPFPHAKRAPTELRVSLPEDVMNAPYDGFYDIGLSCSKDFILLGFEFAEDGDLEVTIDFSPVESFRVTAAPSVMYLTKPRMYKANDRVNIKRVTRAERLSRNYSHEGFIVPCVSPLPPRDKFTMEVTNCTNRSRRPPFATVIFTY